jgi:DNA-binding MarR family transcriptional regulator
MPREEPQPRVRAAEYRNAAQLRADLRSFVRLSEQVTRAHGLTPERYDLLLAIKGRAADVEGATVRELANALRLSPSSVTQLVRRAQQAGLVVRKVSLSDGRVNYLELTDEGERRLARAVAGLRTERRRLRAALDGRRAD